LPLVVQVRGLATLQQVLVLVLVPQGRVMMLHRLHLHHRLVHLQHLHHLQQRPLLVQVQDQQLAQVQGVQHPPLPPPLLQLRRPTNQRPSLGQAFASGCHRGSCRIWKMMFREGRGYSLSKFQ
jgi:hypothetical protein